MSKFPWVGKKGVLFVLALVIVIAALAMNYRPPYTSGSVHWHASVELDICGLPIELPCSVRALAHGETACGTGFLHHHRDDLIHIEGQVNRKEDIQLGKFFQAIGSKFTKTELLDRENGERCPEGGTGTVKLYVNGQPNEQLDEYVPKDKDRLRFVFD